MTFYTQKIKGQVANTDRYNSGAEGWIVSIFHIWPDT